MEWNRAVDCAIASGVSETEVVELKKAEITGKVKESVGQNGSKPELFRDIVRAAILLLEHLIAKVMQKVMDMAEKVISKADDAVKETSKDMDGQIHVKVDSAVRREKKIQFPLYTERKSDAQNKTGQLRQENTGKIKKFVIEQIKAEQKTVPAETKQSETERLPQLKPSILAEKYPRLKEIDHKLKDQNNAIFEREKKRDKLKKELSECTSIFKGGRRKELQQEIDNIDVQISNMKKRLSSIVREYKFDSVQAFYKKLNAAKKEYLDYQAACVEYEQACGDKVPDTMSIRDRLRQKEQVVKIREAGRDDRTRHKDKGAR